MRPSKRTAGNKMFLQWCRDGLVLSFIFVQRLVSCDRTRLRKGTTAETQTLPLKSVNLFQLSFIKLYRHLVQEESMVNLFKGMETKDIIMTLAVLIGPIASIQIQKWLESRRETRQRKLYVFRTLMSTRATRVSIDHVEALNMIDIEFSRDEKVIKAWRSYHDHLTNEDAKRQGWIEKNDDLFIDLLHEMGVSLDYKFDKVMLRRTAYSPVAHGDIEFDQQKIRKGLAKILSWEASLPVFYTNTVETDEEAQAKTDTPNEVGH